MPCCISIINFQGCRHLSAFNSGCTRPGCEGLCPASKQEVLVSTSFPWLCADCHFRQIAEEDEERLKSWVKRVRAIQAAGPPEDQGVENGAYRLESLQARERFELQRLQLWRKARGREIMEVLSWTECYGNAIWALACASMREVDGNGDGKADEAMEEPSQEQGESTAWALEQRIMHMRSSKTPHLTVLRDALRAKDELRQELEEARKKIRRGGQALMNAYLLPDSPNLPRPP
ncbi:hypothetical protein DCS_02737 [Drechmeria coniospora]|uniref:Uncharacterized protein n=1 Tax=Drechmeria coniospora TaxID=98403 RepID=A0A151GWW7_DRECN|nr:hypothetical protein DCS_02737 [Drechmeria coniospora]KYK61594.1 hypothetical protein DCS_02737 [Drechmeria coniospora]ODA79853.1 hypothetical protein RJ55_05450 [Drechmeria coniospora]